MASPRPEVIDAMQHFEDASGDPNAVSPAGAVGKMQIMPATARLYGVDPATLTDDKVNVPLGMRIFGDLLDRYHGNERTALIAYNQGTKKLDAGQIVPSAAQYADNVLARAGSQPAASGNVDQAYQQRWQQQADLQRAQDLVTLHPELMNAIGRGPEAQAPAGITPVEAEKRRAAVEGGGTDTGQGVISGALYEAGSRPVTALTGSERAGRIAGTAMELAPALLPLGGAIAKDVGAFGASEEAASAASAATEAAGAKTAGAEASGGAEPTVPIRLRLGDAIHHAELRDPDGSLVEEGQNEHAILDAEGSRVGRIVVTSRPEQKELSIGMVEQQTGTPQSLVGIMRQLKEAYPWAEKVTGDRATGLNQGPFSRTLAPAMPTTSSVGIPATAPTAAGSQGAAAEATSTSAKAAVPEFPIPAAEAPKQGFLYHGLRGSGTSGEANLAAVREQGVTTGDFAITPHNEYGPPWVAIQKTDLPADSESYTSRFGPIGIRGTEVQRLHSAVSAAKLYATDEQGNITGPLKAAVPETTAAPVPPLLQGKPIVDNNVRADFFQNLVKDVPKGAPGLSTEPEGRPGLAGSVDYIHRKTGGEFRSVVYRGPDGEPVGIAEFSKHTAAEPFTFENFAVDKSKGALAARAAKALGEEGIRIGAVAPESMSSDAARLMAHAQATGTQPVLLTPEAASASLAQRQIDALQAVRVGKETATQFGRPDIATTVPESLTAQESQAVKQTLEAYYAQGTTPPKLAAHVQALADTYHEEVSGIHADNQAMIAKLGRGEDVTQDQANLVNRFSAFAENYSTLAGTQSDAGRGLQILNPNKPGNAFAAATAHLAQEFSIEDNPEQLSEMLDRLKPEQFARVAGQMAEDVGKGRTLYNALHEYYVSNLLSNAGRTGSRIASSNAIAALLTIPRSLVESVIPGSGVKYGEPLARVQGMVDGFWHAVDVMLESGKSGARLSQIEGGTVSPLLDANKAITARAFGLGTTDPTTGEFERSGIGMGVDYLGNVLRLPSRGLTAVHQFGHAVETSMEMHALGWRQAVDQAAGEGAEGLAGYQRAQAIYRDILQNPSSDLRMQAGKAADVATFANRLEQPEDIGPGATRLQDVPYHIQQAFQAPFLKQLMPFFRIAYNVKKMGLDYTPVAGALSQAPNLLNADSGVRGAAAAKVAMGAMFGIAISHEFHQGNIVLDKYGAPFFKIGDKLVQVPPVLDVPIGTVGNYLQNRDAMSEPDALDKAGAAAKALGSSFANDSIVQSMVNIKRLWVDIEGGQSTRTALRQFAGQEASGLIPWSSLLHAVASSEDPYVRDPKTVGQQMETTIPTTPVTAGSESVQPKFDIFAQPVPNASMGIPQRLLYPVNVVEQEKDPVVREMARLGISTASYPPRFLDDYPDDKMKWIKDRGEGLHEDIKGYMDSSLFKTDGDQARAVEIKKMVAEHSHEANMSMLDDPKLAAVIENHKDMLKGLPDELAMPGTRAPVANEFSAAGGRTVVPAIQ